MIKPEPKLHTAASRPLPTRTASSPLARACQAVSDPTKNVMGINTFALLTPCPVLMEEMTSSREIHAHACSLGRRDHFCVAY